MNAVLIGSLLRKFVGRLVFTKRLPPVFGCARIWVTPRADIRLLAPGFAKSAADLLLVAEKYIKPGNCVWDLGANLGIFSFCAAWKAGATGRVYALEADTKYVEMQYRSIRELNRGGRNGYAPVLPLCAAAAGENGIVELAVARKGHARSHLAAVEGNNSGGAEYLKQVVGVSADFLLSHWQRPDFVKLDIDGAEALFLAAADKLLSVARPVLYVEVSANNQAGVTRLLKEHGYSLFALNERGEETQVAECCFNTLAKPEK